MNSFLTDRRRFALALIGFFVPCLLLPAELWAQNAGRRDEPDSLQLTVLDEKDAPVPAANVTVRIRQVTGGPWNVMRLQCDKSGRLRVELPEPAPHYFAVRVELPGFEPFWAEWEPQDTPPDPIPETYTARLDPGQLIGGIVQNEDGKPVPARQVSPHFNLKMREERTFQLGAGVTITTDEKGQWTYPSFPLDVRQVDIALTHPEYAATRISEQTTNIAIPAGGAPSRITVIKRGLTIQGRVHDDSGSPIVGANVAYHERSSSDSPQAETDKEGSYRFTNGRPGEAFMTASAEGWAPSIKKVRIELDMGPVDFKLTRGKPLRVRVVDQENKPLAGVSLSLWTWRGNPIYGQLSSGRGKTDARGEWEWPHAPKGWLRFAISKQGFKYIAEQELTPGERGNVITMLPESLEETRVLKVAGRVFDAETKEPVPRFRVTPGDQRPGRNTIYWHHQNQSESRDGQYRREFTPNMTTSTRHALRIEADGYVPATSRVIDDDEGEVTIDFALQKGKGSDFHVLTPEGEAAKDATVAICTPELGPTIDDGIVAAYSTCERMSTSADGRFSLAPRDGVFALMIVHETGAAYVTPLNLRDSRTIDLVPWARVEGALRIRGKPAVNEPVTLQRDESHERDTPRVHYSYRTTTDKGGKFAFERVVPGAGQVVRNVVSNLDGGMSMWIPTHVVDAQFPAGETTEIDLSREGRPVVGKFVVPKGLEKDNDWRSAMVSLRQPPPRPPDPPPIPFPDDIDPAKDRDAAMKWWEKWKDTEGGKAFQELMKQHQVVVQAMSTIRSPSYGAKVAPDGSFAFDDIPAGNYQLSVSAQSRPANGRFGPGKIIATLTHGFTVQVSEKNSGDEIDLGELQLQPTNN